MKLTLVEVDIGPAQSTKLRGPQAREDCRQQDRPPAALGGLHNSLDLLPCRNVDADLELALLATLGFPLDAAGACLPKITDHVARDEPALLRIAEQGRQRDSDLADHRASPWLRLGALRYVPAGKLVFELADHRRRELRQLHVAQIWLDMKLQVLAICRERRALQTRLVARFKP